MVSTRLGLPYAIEGCKEAKRILQQSHGKDTKVHKLLIKELEALPSIFSIHKLKAIHAFYNNLARVFKTLKTMKRMLTAQSAG